MTGLIRENLLAKFVVGVVVIVLLAGLVAAFFYVGIADRLDAQVDTQVQETSGLHADIYTAWHENRFQDLEAVTVDEQAKSTETVVSMVSDVAAIADETTREAEGTAATAQEQTASMSRVPASVSSLAEQATQLSNALDRFDTGRGAGTGGPTREAMTDDTEREAETDDTAQE